MRTVYIILMIHLAGTIFGQALNVTATVSNGISDALANDYLVPLPVDLTVFDQQVCSHGGFTPGLFGNDYASICFVHAKEEGQVPSHHEVSSYIGSRAQINGNNSSAIQIKWKNTGTNYATTDGHAAVVLSTFSFDLLMEVTGVQPGTPVTVYWWFNAFGGGSTAHEDMLNLEDSIFVTNEMEINGQPQIGNQFNFASPNGLPGWNEWQNVTGTFKNIAGTGFSFSVNSTIRLYLNEPAGPGGFGFGIDQNDGIFKGEIVFTLVPQYPPVTDNTEDMMTLFSLDIGSDTEFSDPKQDGNEFFDPGDLYHKDRTGPLPAVTPFRNDYAIFGSDPDPKNSPPIGPAPVGSGLQIDALRSLYFDLDGTDLIGANLSPLIGSDPLNASIPWFSDSCIFEAEFIYLAFDDDTPPNYASAAPLSAPVTSSSPSLGKIYSDMGTQDEIMEFDFSSTPASGVFYQDTVDSEYLLHLNLAPDPLLIDDLDDDVDALDMIYYFNDTTPCTQWYFTADHEATAFDPNSGNELNPAAIYRATGSGPVPVITNIHHGLLPGTDIDGFEFCWVWDQAEGRFGLALLFSVDDDDPLTPVDESGGLNPRMLYFSFLDGSSHPFSAHQLNEDIDGITAWKHSLNGVSSFPLPTWGTKTWNGSFNANWNHYLNWFPRGVPFHPETVTVPNVSPSPVIGTTGLDCRSLETVPGAQVILLNGRTFTIKGP